MAAAAIALNRFGLGARPGDSVGDPKRWLLAQFERYQARPAALAAAPTSLEAATDFAEYQRARREVRADRPAMTENASPTMPDARRPAGPRAVEGGAGNVISEAERAAALARRQGRDHYAASVGMRMNAALATPAPFVERLVHFWSNHFAISADKLQVVGFAGPFEFEAIRPHVLGTFRQMLFAVERHPAMLFYLDQAQSAGPNSMMAEAIGRRAARNGNQRKLGLNENLAREIMELHTLGVRTGYSQADVTEFARAMTGWTVVGAGRGVAGRQAGASGRPGDFAFAPRLHEPGTRTIMGKSFAEEGVDQAAAVLDMLAVHPATARHIATKLVRHFVADDPPAAAVARCEAAFLQSGGDLPTVYRALIDAPEAWAPTPAKFKTPWEWSVSTLRGLGLNELGTPQTVGLLQQLGQPTWRPGSPAGWDDIGASWAGPDAIMRRVEAAERFANRAGQQINPTERAGALLPGALGTATQTAISRAESPAQGMALLLVSPEFLRR